MIDKNRYQNCLNFCADFVLIIYPVIFCFFLLPNLMLKLKKYIILYANDDVLTLTFFL